MKTRFSRRTSFLSPLLVLALSVIGALILIALILRVFFPGTLTLLAYPFSALGRFAVSGFESVEGREELVAQVAQLSEENTILTNENETLRARLADIGADAGLPGSEGLSAAVLLRPPMAPYDVLVIALPQGASTNGAQIFAKGTPIGTLSGGGSGAAHVALYSASGRETQAWLGEERLPITVKGEGAGAFSASVPRDLPVAQGDYVYISGPGPLPIGIVREIENHPSSPSARLSIEPLVNPYTLTHVRIVAP